MDALDLDVEDAVRIDIDAIVLFDVLRESFLAQVLDGAELLEERLILYVVVEQVELLRMTMPAAAADGRIDEVRELRVCAHEPAAVRDAVRLVVEHARVVLVEVVQCRGLEDVRVDLRDTVDAVRADNRQTGHVDHAVLDDGELVDFLLVVRIAVAHIDEPAAVDLVDDHVDARQQRLEHVDWPLLECLRHDRVVRVGNRVLRDSPCLIPLEALLINEDAHELGDAECRMRVVDVDGDLLGEVMDVHTDLLVVTDDALDTSRDEEVLLYKAQATAIVGAVIRIEVARDALDEVAVLVLLAHLFLRQAAVVGEVAVDLCIPEAKCVDRVVVITDDRHVVRHSHDRHRILVDELEAAIRHLLHVGIAVELDIDGLIRLAVLPGKAVLEPVVRDLDLVALDDLLLEQAVLVADAAAVARQAVCCHRVDEAGGKAAEAAVAEACVWLFIERLDETEVEVLQDFLDGLFDAEIDEIRLEQAAEQEFDGEIVDLLLLALCIRLICLDPVVGDELLCGSSHRLVNLILREVLDLTAIHQMCRADKTKFQILLELVKLAALLFLFLCFS